MGHKSGNSVRRSCLAAAVIASCGWSVTALADTWHESGEAGESIATAQSTLSLASLSSITGTISANTDVDLYKVYIYDFGAFSATTVGGAAFDTQLFLFYADGRGIASNDDVISGNHQSTLPVGSALYSSLPAGEYLLGISSYNVDPRDSSNSSLFSGASDALLGPVSATAILHHWAGSGTGGTGAYEIFLGGASLVPLPPAATAGLSGLACVLGFTALRRRRSAR